jgi:hypothetical protein
MFALNTLFPLGKSIPVSTIEHGCCLFPRIHHHHHIHPVNNSKNLHLNTDQQENEQRKIIENYVFAKLEAYSRQKSTHLFHLTSLSHIRRHLKRDVKDLSKQFQPNIVSEEKILQWIDETLERINSHFPHLQRMIDSQNELKQLFLINEIFSSQNQNNQFQQLQLKRAHHLFPETNFNDKELLLHYQKYIPEILTPKKLENDRLPLKNNQPIDLDFEYNQAENFGRKYLTKIFDDYKQRQYPDINLIKEMINHGMEQMIKRPKTEELHKASQSSNILYKALLILKSKNAYSMSFKNIADDFMVEFYIRFSKEIFLLF